MAVHLITGDDESLLLGAASEVVHRLIGDGDRSLMVDEFDDAEFVLLRTAATGGRRGI